VDIYTQVCGTAVARLGVTPSEFYEMTPSEFYTSMAFKAQMEKEEYKSKMEAARYIATHVWNASQRSLKKTQMDPTKLLPFAWDKKEKPKQSIAAMKSILVGLTHRQNKKTERHGITGKDRGTDSAIRTRHKTV